MKTRKLFQVLLPLGASCLVAALLTSTAQARVLDNFNDNTKAGWTDFVFAPGVGTMTEQSGAFAFTLPGEATYAYGPLFCASTKSSEIFTLQEGRTIEFRVDVTEGGGDRSYATLAFVPTASGGPSQLKGYTLAKSPTDVLLLKGLEQYFVDDDVTAPAKQNNITLVLSLRVKGGSVFIHGEILDKDQNDAVIWERTFVDTPGTDILQTGTDSPPAPYLGDGNFVLMLYANGKKGDPTASEFPFKVTYDNAEVFVTEAVLIDDFNDGTKTGWTDYSPVPIPGFGLPIERNGQLDFEMDGGIIAAYINSPVFTATTKVSPLLEIKEGEELEFRVDITKAGGKDSFAVLGFIPTTSGGPALLQGYTLAKAPEEVILGKGIQKYFVDDDTATGIVKQTNVTLVLSTTTRNGSVTIDAKILDKDANDAVLWQRRVVDTPNADQMAAGTDSPQAPFIGTGNFVLMLYANYHSASPEPAYLASFDNATVYMPPVVGNLAPIIDTVLPTDRANFLPAPAQISFRASDDQPLDSTKMSILLNGTNYTTANGLTVSGTGKTLNVSLSGLGPDINYVATLRAEDSNGEFSTKTLYFDTFLINRLMIEAEDYNYGSGQFIDNVVLVPESSSDPNSYSMLEGTSLIDYLDTRPNAAGLNDNPYREFDKVRAGRSRDNTRAKYTAAGGSQAGVFDYDVGDIAAGEWMNYTKTFPVGSYEVYLREAIANIQTAESVLEKVTSDPTQENQTTSPLGSFLGTITGFTYRNFALTDGSGMAKKILRLSGPTTLRLRNVTGDTSDGARLLNYLVFIPVPDAGVARPDVNSVEPAPNSTIQSVEPVIQAVIANHDTTVNVSTVKLQVNGQDVNALVTPTATGANVAYSITPLPPANSAVQARITFKDNEGVSVTSSWQFTLTYPVLDPALAIAGVGKTRGFNVRTVQQDLADPTPIDNSLVWAESLLNPSTTILKAYDTNTTAQVINYSQWNYDGGTGTQNEGDFPNDALIPGIDVTFWTDGIAMEITTYLNLAVGKYRFGAHCDDGFKVQVVQSFNARGTAPLAFHDGGPANQTYDFYVSQAGLYPFRMVWYEKSGGASVEWFQGNFANTNRVLLNSAGQGNVAAYTSYAAQAVLAPPAVQGGTITISWTGTGILEQSSNLKDWTAVPGAPPSGSYQVTPGAGSGGLFYRVKQ